MLAKAGIGTVEQLCQCRMEDLFRVRGLGRAGVARIRRRLGEVGLAIAGERIVKAAAAPPKFSEPLAVNWCVSVDNDRHTPAMAILGSGIYFLCRSDVVVYVGQAKCIAARVASHLKEKAFDNFWFVTVPIGGLNRAEARMIAKYDPCLNQTRPRCR